MYEALAHICVEAAEEDGHITKRQLKKKIEFQQPENLSYIGKL
jgi:hypothetical protein